MAAVLLQGAGVRAAPVREPVQIGEKPVGRQVGAGLRKQHAAAPRQQRAVDARTADEAQRICRTGTQGFLQGRKRRKHRCARHGESGRGREDPVLAVRQRARVGKGEQGLAAIDHGLPGRERAEAAQVGGNGDKQIAVLPDAPVLRDVDDAVHGSS